PRFYGQNYNTMLEALLSVPLLKCGVALYHALPLITSMLALLPYFIIALLTYFRKSKTTGILLLTIPLLLPVEYEMTTCLSRGFVTGIAIASVCCLPLFTRQSPVVLFFAGMAAIVGYSVNANSVLVSVPCLLLLFLQNTNNKKFYLFSGLGFITGLVLHLCVAWFYTKHSDYVLHTFTNQFSIEYLIKGISNLDLFFNNVTPVFSKQGWMVLLFFTIISCVLFIQKKKKEGVSVLLMLVLTIVPLSASKVHEGFASVFFSNERMYLAVPVMLALSISFITVKRQMILYSWVAITACFFVFKLIKTPDTINRNLKNHHFVTVIKNSELIDECKKISAISLQNKVDLIIVNGHKYYDLYTYGCAACIDKFPETIRPVYERRTWQLTKVENIIYKNILLIDSGRNFSEEYPDIAECADLEGFYLLKENTMPTIELLKALKIDVRSYKTTP
ncbi:MAG: hypothetical protein AB7G44_17505, partial [Bacteroidia bacterium]